MIIITKNKSGGENLFSWKESLCGALDKTTDWDAVPCSVCLQSVTDQFFDSMEPWNESSALFQAPDAVTR